jgi:thioredoxin reductase (NADPH)
LKLIKKVIVIGGGSGGVQFAKKASNFGAKVCVLDYVKKTNHNSKWGLGKNYKLNN